MAELLARAGVVTAVAVPAALDTTVLLAAWTAGTALGLRQLWRCW